MLVDIIGQYWVFSDSSRGQKYVDACTLQHGTTFSHNKRISEVDLVLADKVWLTVGLPVHPKGAGWGWGQDSAGQAEKKKKK